MIFFSDFNFIIVKVFVVDAHFLRKESVQTSDSKITFGNETFN